MKPQNFVLLAVVLVMIGAVLADQYYVSKLELKFREVEKQRIITSNKLATAKIVYENLNHVRDLVFDNMDFPGQVDTVTNETHFFNFVTSCVADLKLKLLSVKPLHPIVSNRVTMYGYDIEIEGDFFKYGELCSKFENSRRIVSVESFGVDLLEGRTAYQQGGNKGIRVKMRVTTFRVSKAVEPTPVPQS